MKTYAYGKNGVIVDMGPMAYLREMHKLPPLLEIAVVDLEVTSTSEELSVNVSQNWKDSVQFAYRLRQSFGFFGDIIAIDVDDVVNPKQFKVEWSAHLAFPKAALAADLVVFILDSERKLFWVGITRGRPPGIGKQALIGGFRAIVKVETSLGPTHMLESALTNLMHECPEEVGIRLFDPYRIATAGGIFVIASIPPLGISAHSLIYGLGTVSTDVAVERSASTGEMRVHETTGYALLIRAERPLAADEILAVLHPTDLTENATPLVCEIRLPGDIRRISCDFHSSHHSELFDKAVAWCVNEINAPPQVPTL